MARGIEQNKLINLAKRFVLIGNVNTRGRRVTEAYSGRIKREANGQETENIARRPRNSLLPHNKDHPAKTTNVPASLPADPKLFAEGLKYFGVLRRLNQVHELLGILLHQYS